MRLIRLKSRKLNGLPSNLYVLSQDNLLMYIPPDKPANPMGLSNTKYRTLSLMWPNSVYTWTHFKILAKHTRLSVVFSKLWSKVAKNPK